MDQTLLSITSPSNPAPALEPIQEIIPRTKLGKAIVGKELSCKFCHDQAKVVLEEGRYKMRCFVCQAEYYLKEISL